MYYSFVGHPLFLRIIHYVKCPHSSFRLFVKVCGQEEVAYGTKEKVTQVTKRWDEGGSGPTVGQCVVITYP